MNAFDDETREMVRTSVQRFVRERYGFARRRELLGLESGSDASTWRELAGQGWLGIGLPERHGGLGALRDLGLVMESIGAALVLEPYLGQVVLAGGLIALLGSEAQQARHLVPLVEGRGRPALAYLESHARFDPFDWRCVARRQGDGNELSGRKSTVLGGASASVFVVAAQGDGRDAPGLWLVDARAPGVRIEPRRLFDGQVSADLVLDHVVVGPEAALGVPGTAFGALEEVLDRGAAALCAEACGAMNRSFDATLAYLKTRSQFGQPLARNQALQHRMVDLYNLLREAESMTRHALESLDLRDPHERSVAVSAAKCHVGAIATTIGQESVQLHGAIGTTDELDISHYFKRLTAIDLSLGTRDWHAARLGRLLETSA